MSLYLIDYFKKCSAAALFNLKEPEEIVHTVFCKIGFESLAHQVSSSVTIVLNSTVSCIENYVQNPISRSNNDCRGSLEQ